MVGRQWQDDESPHMESLLLHDILVYMNGLSYTAQRPLRDWDTFYVIRSASASRALLLRGFGELYLCTFGVRVFRERLLLAALEARVGSLSK